ncbi:hypothetical protein U1Q18_014061 [Sarracenia purpurea var. burkii]
MGKKAQVRKRVVSSPPPLIGINLLEMASRLSRPTTSFKLSILDMELPTTFASQRTQRLSSPSFDIHRRRVHLLSGGDKAQRKNNSRSSNDFSHSVFSCLTLLCRTCFSEMTGMALGCCHAVSLQGLGARSDSYIGAPRY